MYFVQPCKTYLFGHMAQLLPCWVLEAVVVLIVGEAISAHSSCEVILRERCNQSVIIELKGMGVSATLLQNLFSFSSVTILLSFLHDYFISF